MEIVVDRVMASAISAAAPATKTRPSRDVCDLRSLFFVRPDRIAKKMTAIEGTSLILDLEDGVPAAHKEARRQQIAELLAAGTFVDRHLLIRTNSLENGFDAIEADLRTCLHRDVYGLILPMLERADNVRVFDALVREREHALGIPTGSVAFFPLLERAEGVLNALEIARASSRVRALCFGHADFLLSLGGAPGRMAVDMALPEVLLAAGAAGVPAIASPYLDLANKRGFRHYCARMRELGFSGVFTLNPAQDTIARTVFAVTALETQHARAVLDVVNSGASIAKVNGQMVGPPMAARAKQFLSRSTAEPRAVSKPIVGSKRKYGLQLDTVFKHQMLESPHELTVDEGWRTLWLASFPTSNRLVTSETYAQAWGLSGRALPPSLLLNLTLCMSVEPFSHSCRLHLGLHDARQLAPAHCGDTFRNYIRIESVRNTSRGDASVIKSTHVLVNQRDECVFRLTKMSYFDPVRNPTNEDPAAPDLETARLFDETGATPFDDIFRDRRDPPSAPSFPLTAGEVILHPMVRPIAWSENLLLTTLLRNTHPVHFDSERYAREEIIVCGGFVQSMVFAAAESELRQVLAETLVHASHINTVAPNDRIGAISRIASVEPIGPRLEIVRLKTLGLKNLHPERDLDGLELPSQLFEETSLKPSEIEDICRRERPELEGRIALQATRVLVRARS